MRTQKSVAVASRTILHQDVPDLDTNDAGDQDLFRQYFETRFEPLKIEPRKNTQRPVHEHVEVEIESDLSDWDGISDEDGPAAEIIEHQESIRSWNKRAEAPEVKMFMSPKPPAVSALAISTRPKIGTAEDAYIEAVNLKNDLDLQRLIQESHLVNQSGASASGSSQRHKAIDLRMRSFGSRSSLFAQGKMPLPHRRGIQARASAKEDIRRKDAKENGVILERASIVKKDKVHRRERGVGDPSVGKFSGGTLRLSRKDVRDINGPQRPSGKSGRRRR